MIKRRFFNFNTYNGFLSEQALIPNDAIVFIQDKPCIWAHGKEYVCDGPYTANTEGLSLKFKNGNEREVFSVSINNGTITITDENGNTIELELALKSEIDSIIDELSSSISTKQNILNAGYGINIVNDTISSTLDSPIMVTLTTAQYEALVRTNTVNKDTYYFTYEETTWGFGDRFPVTFTDGDTSDSIGTFPINLE